MTYRELCVKLLGLSNTQLNCDVMVKLEDIDEYYPSVLEICDSAQNVFDEGYPVIVVKGTHKSD